MCGMAGLAEDLSSDDTDIEEQDKLSSAIWEPHTSLHKLSVDRPKKTHEIQNVLLCEEKRSRRENNTDTSDEDYRSLQITPGFRKHVAEKLKTFLDSSIITESVNKTNRQVLEDCEDKGLLLFSTSSPVATWLMSPSLPKAPVRKRQASSSDSDSEEENLRLNSVAVDGMQILKEGSLLMSNQQVTQVISNLNISDSEEKKQSNVIELNKRKKKRKKSDINDECVATSSFHASESFSKEDEKKSIHSTEIEEVKQFKKHQKKKKESDNYDKCITTSSCDSHDIINKMGNGKLIYATENEEGKNIEKKNKKHKKKKKESNDKYNPNFLHQPQGAKNDIPIDSTGKEEAKEQIKKHKKKKKKINYDEHIISNMS